MSFIKLYIVAFVIFIILDLVWLGFVARGLYQEQLGHVMAERVRWSAAIIFYLLFTFGILFFAVYPALAKNNILYALLYGAIFGLICYATYDLTNLATVKNWPVKIVFYDLIWGTCLSGFTAFVTAVVGILWK